ncbi:MAG: OstA-likeN domain-containing protein [Nitrospira sp.]|nr:MAG: OstA-likeN domain-containing protein [Nitrospira sp.]
MWMSCLLLSGEAVLGTQHAYAAEPRAAKESPANSAPTTITSRTMTVNNQENTAIFDGAVVLTRGLLVVHSDHMVVSFHPSRNGADSKDSGGTTKSKNLTSPTTAEAKEQDSTPAVSERSIRMVEATGRVNIKKEDGQATCQKAVYYEDQKKIVLTGEPVAWQKGTRVSGKRIIMFLDEDRSVVEGDSQVIIEGEGGGKR